MIYVNVAIVATLIENFTETEMKYRIFRRCLRTSFAFLIFLTCIYLLETKRSRVDTIPGRFIIQTQVGTKTTENEKQASLSARKLLRNLGMDALKVEQGSRKRI